MTTSTLELHFSGQSEVELIETRFDGPWNEKTIVAIRGKTIGLFKNVGSFQWTSAVRAFCVLCIRSVIAVHDRTATAGQLSGAKSSLAASLDYALSKQPAWLREVCGADSQGQAHLRKLIVRTNPERKRPGPVVLGLNERAIRVEDIHIFWNRKKLSSPAELQPLLRAINTEAENARALDLLMGSLNSHIS